MKSLSVLAILIGEGFSILYEDADNRFGTRLAGVVIGLGYVALMVWLARRRDASWPTSESGRLRSSEAYPLEHVG